MPAMKIGRPTLYNEKTVDRICFEIAHGKTLNKLCQEEWAPNQTLVYNWLDKHPAFLEKYRIAREQQAEYFANEIVDITDNKDIPRDKEGRADSAWVQMQKLRVDARKWHAAKTAPRKYGDRQITQFEGEDGKPFEIIVKNLTTSNNGKE